MAITAFEDNAKLFVGQGDLIMFDEITAYDSATLANFSNPKSLGQIVQDSTTWDGDDVSVDQIKDEQGDIITARTTAGTIAFSFEIASTSPDMVKTFLKGTSITADSATGFTEVTAVTGFGTSMPVITRPIAIINDGLNRAWVYPKAKITSNLSLSDGLWRIKASVIAETVDTANLKTGMIIEAKAEYPTA